MTEGRDAVVKSRFFIISGHSRVLRIRNFIFRNAIEIVGGGGENGVKSSLG